MALCEFDLEAKNEDRRRIRADNRQVIANSGRV